MRALAIHGELLRIKLTIDTLLREAKLEIQEANEAVMDEEATEMNARAALSGAKGN